VYFDTTFYWSKIMLHGFWKGVPIRAFFFHAVFTLFSRCFHAGGGRASLLLLAVAFAFPCNDNDGIKSSEPSLINQTLAPRNSEPRD